MLLEAIKSGGRDVTSDLGSFVQMTNGASGLPSPQRINKECDQSCGRACWKRWRKRASLREARPANGKE